MAWDDVPLQVYKPSVPGAVVQTPRKCAQGRRALLWVYEKRFHILKTPILFRDVVFVNDIFITCTVLHNKLLDYNKHMEKRYGVFRHGVTPSLTKEGRRTVLVNNVRRLLDASDDFSYVDIRDSGDIITEVDPEFESKRKRLAHHIFYLFVHKLLKYTVKSYYKR